MALPLVPAFPCHLSFPQEFRQCSLHPALHKIRLVLRALTLSTELSPSQSSNLTPSDQNNPDSPHSTFLMQSTRIFHPGLPITYNETALTRLHGRLQMMMLNYVSIPLPPSSDEESPTDSDDQLEESSAEDLQDQPPLTSRGRLKTSTEAEKIQCPKDAIGHRA